MKEVEPGWIVSASEMEGQYVVLCINLNQGAAVLLSRDGKKRVVRGVPLQSLQIIPEQMEAWAHEHKHFLSEYATDAIGENSQPTKG